MIRRVELHIIGFPAVVGFPLLLTNIILICMLCFRPPKKGKKGGATPKAKVAPSASAGMAAAVGKGSVPENVLKKQQSDSKFLRIQSEQRDLAKAVRAESRKKAAANATRYAQEYADADKAIVDAKRAAKKDGNFYVDAQAKIAFVVRTRG